MHDDKMAQFLVRSSSNSLCFDVKTDLTSTFVIAI